MGTVSATTPRLVTTAPPFPRVTVDRSASSEADRHATYDGLAWSHRPGAEPLLTGVSAQAWCQPERQGWQRVKQNTSREVWRAVIGGSPYYLKYYFRDHWLRVLRRLFRDASCRAEWEAGRFAQRAGLPATRPVAYAMNLRRGRRRCDLLVSEAVEPAHVLSDFWRSLISDDDVRRRRQDAAQLGERLAEMIARAHQAGFEHLDLHAANVLVQPVGPRRYRTLFVDLQSARRDVPVGDHAIVRNLAQLNQWFRRNSSIGDRLRFLRAYLRWRNEYETAFPHGRPIGLTFRQLVAALGRAAERHARHLWAQRDRRTARDGRYFTRLRLPGGWRGMAVVSAKHATDDSLASRLKFERSWWQQQLAQPLRWFAGETAGVCKDSHSASVRRATLLHHGQPLPVIIKRPLARSGRRRLAQLWPPSRSRRAWGIGHALLHRDLPTARPLAMLERRWGPFVLDSMLITEALPGTRDLESHLRDAYESSSPRGWARTKQTLASVLAAHLRQLHERGFQHRDCKASNILVRPGSPPRLTWIDLDGLRRASRFTHRRRFDALVRLHVSLCNVPGLTRTDRLRVLRAYLTRLGHTPDSWRELWRALTRAAARKQSAKAARRAWKLKHYGRE